jgi:hypothetical protein
VQVDARLLRGGKRNSGYGLICRSDAQGESYYTFAIWPTNVTIAKVTPSPPYYKELAAEIPTIQRKGRNRLDAVCATDKDGVVRLTFSINGLVVARASDRKSTLTSGAVGLAVATDKGEKAITTEFDDFVVKKA